MDATTPITPDAPLHVRLAHDQPLHAQLVARLSQMAKEGEGHIQKRHGAWNEVDKALRLYVDLSKMAVAADGSEIAGKKEQPVARSFMIPLTYANLMSRMAMKYAALTSRDPLIHLEPVDSDDLAGARMHEAALRWSITQSRGPLLLWQLLYDQERYGFSYCYDTWEEEWGWRQMDQPFPSEVAGALPFHLRALAQPSSVWTITRQWARWQAIDPYRAIVDGSQSLWDPQAWAYAGHWGLQNWLHLYERRLENDTGPYFNVDHARQIATASAAGDASARNTSGSFNDSAQLEGTYPNLKLTHLQVRIIPREWQLASSDRPEVWWFAMVNDELLVRAHPKVYRHGEITYSSAIADLDQHAPFTAGSGEQLDGIQRLVNYLVFSHVENTRKMLNDAMVFDPSLLNERDLYQPGPGRYVRLQKRGQQLLQRGMIPISGMFQQIGVGDITGQHMQTAMQFMEFAQLLSGASSPAQGQVFTSKRTLGEVEKAVSGSTQRVGVDMQLFDEQMVASLTPRAISNLQQFLSVEQAITISSDMARQMGQDRRRLALRPGDLRGQYNYVARTPSMAPDPARTAAVWGAVLQVLAGAPQLLAPYDGKQLSPHEIFNEFARAEGVHYIDKFYRPVAPPMAAPQLPGGMPPQLRVVADAVAERAAAAGNALPRSLPRMA